MKPRWGALAQQFRESRYSRRHGLALEQLAKALGDTAASMAQDPLGAIEESAEIANGVARATLRSTGTSGTATVTARSGSIEPVSVEIRIGIQERVNR